MDNVTAGTTSKPINMFELHAQLTRSQIYGFGITFAIIAVTSVIINLLMIIAILRNRNGNMWTVTNIYIFNMAFVDLLTGLIIIPCRTVQLIYKYWFLGNFLCIIHVAFEKMLFCCGIYTLTLVAFARYQVIINPLAGSHQLKGALWRLGIVWLLSVIAFIPLMIHMPFYIYASKKVLVGNTDCVPKFSSNEERDRFALIYYSLFMVFGFILPLIIITYCFYRIYAALYNRKHNTSLISTMKIYSTVINRTNRKVINMLLTIAILFFICWFPHNVTIILYNVVRLPDLLTKTVCDHRLFINISQIGKIFCYFNSCQNVIVCLIFNEPFRDAIIDILTLGYYQKKQLLLSNKPSNENVAHLTLHCTELSRTELGTIKILQSLNTTI